MGYEVGMQSTILELLRLFRANARDRETNAWVSELVADRVKWPLAHDLSDQVRHRLQTEGAEHAACVCHGIDSYDDLLANT